jgi:hypothetical protein
MSIQSGTSYSSCGSLSAQRTHVIVRKPSESILLRYYSPLFPASKLFLHCHTHQSSFHDLSPLHTPLSAYFPYPSPCSVAVVVDSSSRNDTDTVVVYKPCPTSILPLSAPTAPVFPKVGHNARAYTAMTSVQYKRVCALFIVTDVVLVPLKCSSKHTKYACETKLQNMVVHSSQKNTLQLVVCVHNVLSCQQRIWLADWLCCRALNASKACP